MSATEQTGGLSDRDIPTLSRKPRTHFVMTTTHILKTWPLKPAYPISVAAGLIIAACLVSNAIWVLNDRHVWPWDQANYADWSVRLWQARLSGIGAWAHAVVGVLGG